MAIATKICLVCKTEKLADAFYFRSDAMNGGEQ